MTTPDRVIEAARAICGGHLTQSQVDGILFLKAQWARDHAQADPRWFAYILATVRHETAATFQPIEEIGRGHGRAYGTTYYGRGYCQLTWVSNYARFGRLLGIDLVSHPELALVPATAATILFRGMIDGLYTGRALGDYIDGPLCQFNAARRIVNGLDCASTIETYARAFADALGGAA